ncbi:hypothetical protein [Reichenbachiella sp.]
MSSYSSFAQLVDGFAKAMTDMGEDQKCIAQIFEAGCSSGQWKTEHLQLDSTCSSFLNHRNFRIKRDTLLISPKEGAEDSCIFFPTTIMATILNDSAVSFNLDLKDLFDPKEKNNKNQSKIPLIMIYNFDSTGKKSFSIASKK